MQNIDGLGHKPSKGLCKVKKIPKIIWKWVGGSRSHLDNKKKLENCPKIKFCVCTMGLYRDVWIAALRSRHPGRDWRL